MKKLVIPMIVLLAVALAVAGCSSGTPSASSPAASIPASPSTTLPPASTPAQTSPAPTATAPSATTTTPASASQQYGGTLRYIAPAGPGAPIGAPWLSNGTSTFAMQFAEESLLNEHSDASLTPRLATSYDVNTDPTSPSITFHLQQGVKFQDGTDFNAQAVKWNLDQEMAPGSTNLGSTRDWKSIDVVDDYTVRVNLKTFTNIAARTFADSMWMVSPTAYQKNGADWMNFNMVGTGAFTQQNYQSDVSLTMVKNPNYWQAGKPYLDQVQLLFVSDPLTAEALFKSGGAEVIQVYDDQMGADLEAAGYKIDRVFNYGGSLWPDSANADSPWSNLKVREAAEYAIDKQALANRFGYGNWQPAYQYSNSSSPAYDPNLAPRTYDVAKAKQLLAEAGYPNGFKTTIIVSSTGVSRDVAVALQAYFAAAGIQATLQFPQTAAWAGYLTGNPWHDAVLFGPAPGWANPNAGWNLTYSAGSAWFKSLARPAGMADLYAKSLATPQLDPTILQQCEDLLYNDVNTIPLYFSAKEWGLVNSVQNADLGTHGIWAFWDPQDTWMSK